MLTGTGFIRLHGKGRKERTVPLWKQTVRQIRHWLQEIASGKNDPLFPNSEGMHLTRSAIRKRLIAAAKKAASNCPTLKDKRISPHAFRHTTALHLLQSGVDISVIALWLGHENIETTHLYIVANLELKEKALNKLQEPNTRTRRFVPDDSLLRFLDGL
jgi:site-specific recombinase XerD